MHRLAFLAVRGRNYTHRTSALRLLGYINKRASGTSPNARLFSLWDQFILKNPPATREVLSSAIRCLPSSLPWGRSLWLVAPPPGRHISRSTSPLCPSQRHCEITTPAAGAQIYNAASWLWAAPSVTLRVTASGPGRSIVVQPTAVVCTRFTPHLRVANAFGVVFRNLSRRSGH